MPRCEQCRFYCAHSPGSDPNTISISAEGIRGGGECRLRPPVQVENETLARLPIVANDSWCGRFEPSE